MHMRSTRFAISKLELSASTSVAGISKCYLGKIRKHYNCQSVIIFSYLSAVNSVSKAIDKPPETGTFI